MRPILDLLMLAKFPDPDQAQAVQALQPLPAVGIVTAFVLVALMIGSLWNIYSRAGQPGWTSLIPFYSLYVLQKIVNRPGWWVVLYFIPFVGLVIWIVNMYDLARSFGHGVGYLIGLLFLPLVFFPLVAFGKSPYRPIPREV